MPIQDCLTVLNHFANARRNVFRIPLASFVEQDDFKQVILEQDDFMQVILSNICSPWYATDCRLLTAQCILHIACCMLHVTCCMLHVACCMLHVTCRLLYTLCCMLSAVCCMLYVVCLAQPSPAQPSLAQPCTAQPCTALHSRAQTGLRGSKDKCHFLFDAGLSILDICNFWFNQMIVPRNQSSNPAIQQSSNLAI
jgi:hypothetical protein